MKGSDLLARLAIPIPSVELSGGTAAPMARLLGATTSDLCAATRAVLRGEGVDQLITAIDRAAIWPPMAAGVRVAAEVAAHVADQRGQVIPQRDPDQ